VARCVHRQRSQPSTSRPSLARGSPSVSPLSSGRAGQFGVPTPTLALATLHLRLYEHHGSAGAAQGLRAHSIPRQHSAPRNHPADGVALGSPAALLPRRRLDLFGSGAIRCCPPSVWRGGAPSEVSARRRHRSIEQIGVTPCGLEGSLVLWSASSVWCGSLKARVRCMARP
jgi:hypothetical protein